MYNTFCTLFDSGYLDKGLALYESMNKHIKDFKLYILTMDDRSYEILSEYKLEKAILIKEEEFLNDELRDLKNKRSRAEYCWTCSAACLKYVFEKYNEEICTYLDADLYFYDDVKSLEQEFEASGSSVGIVEHRFDLQNEYCRKQYKEVGRYCVQYNTFKNDDYGLKALNWWYHMNIEMCTANQDGEVFGDQKYLDDWTTRFEKVHEYQDFGGGVAPWNISRYKTSKHDDKIMITDKASKDTTSVIFVHFQGLSYLEDGRVALHVFTRPERITPKAVQDIYTPYVAHTSRLRKELEDKYGLSFRIKTDEERKTDSENYKKSRTMNIKEIVRLIKRAMYYRYDFIKVK